MSQSANSSNVSAEATPNIAAVAREAEPFVQTDVRSRHFLVGLSGDFVSETGRSLGQRVADQAGMGIGANSRVDGAARVL